MNETSPKMSKAELKELVRKMSDNPIEWTKRELEWLKSDHKKPIMVKEKDGE